MENEVEFTHYSRESDIINKQWVTQANKHQRLQTYPWEQVFVLSFRHYHDLHLYFFIGTVVNGKYTYLKICQFFENRNTVHTHTRTHTNISTIFPWILGGLFRLLWNVVSLHEKEKPINPSPTHSTQEKKNKSALAQKPTKAVTGAVLTVETEGLLWRFFKIHVVIPPLLLNFSSFYTNFFCTFCQMKFKQLLVA